MIIGYARVSTVDQNLDRQLESIKDAEKVFTDKCSGKNADREGLKALINHVREGDHILVHSIDRIARSLPDLRELIDGFIEQGISIEFKKENLKFDGNESSISKLLLNVIGAVAEFELSMIRERQLEGIAAYKMKNGGKWAGRKTNQVKLERAHQLKAEGLSQRAIAKELDCSLSSVVRYLKQEIC